MYLVYGEVYEEESVDTYIQLFIPKIYICIYLETKTIDQPTPSYSI
jgi:hypothetical protein